jgi:hypothetical protein
MVPQCSCPCQNSWWTSQSCTRSEKEAERLRNTSNAAKFKSMLILKHVSLLIVVALQRH